MSESTHRPWVPAILFKEGYGKMHVVHVPGIREVNTRAIWRRNDPAPAPFPL